jgi:hypothetical protein
VVGADQLEDGVDLADGFAAGLAAGCQQQEHGNEESGHAASLARRKAIDLPCRPASCLGGVSHPIRIRFVFITDKSLLCFLMFGKVSNTVGQLTLD